MSLLVPGALALLSLAIPLLVLYMLRSRRQRFEVPSVMLWSGEEEFVSAAVPWQRLKITAALLLQLLALAAFAFLLSRPFFEEETLLGPHTVMIIDTSGSMGMENRLDTAKARAIELSAEASDAQLISVVSGGPSPRVLAAFSRDPEGLRTAIESLSVTGGSDELGEALRLARGLATPDRPTTILFLGDGGIPGSVTEPVTNALHVPFDDTGDNVAITGFGAGAGAGETRMFLEVTSYSNKPESVTAELEVDGLSVGSVDVDLDPGQRSQKAIAVEAGPGQVVTVALRDHVDSLPLDDSSAAVLSGSAEVSVAVLGEGSRFLDALLGSISGVRDAAGLPPDVVIIDRDDASIVDRPAWIIAPETPPPGVEVIGVLEFPVITYQRSGEPILEGIDLADLAIAEAQIVNAPGWLSLLRAGEIPLILLGEVDGQRAIYLTFDLTRSNLPVQVSFPILGSRLIDWLGGSRVTTASTAPAGTPIPLVTPQGSTARVTLPDGSRRDLVEGLLTFNAATLPGVYRVEYVAEDGTIVPGPVAARQFVASESTGETRTIAVVDEGTQAAETSQLLREWAPFIAALLLAIVLLEWWVAYGRPMPARRGEGEAAT
ncbi:MAG: VWA domain-containing protein [Acidimicrobiia bacterium]|nr:VWA domain-containing protein [Acidimicrobiia bacterium]